MIGSIAFQINRHSNGRVCDWLVNRIEAIIKALSFVRKRKHEYRTNSDSIRFRPIPPESSRNAVYRTKGDGQADFKFK